MEDQKKLRILSLGAGVQSTTITFMAECGEIEPYDALIFADTGAEPKIVMKHLSWLESQVKVPVYRVMKGKGLKVALVKAIKYKTRVASIPFFTKTKGKEGKM